MAAVGGVACAWLGSAYAMLEQASDKEHEDTATGLKFAKTRGQLRLIGTGCRYKYGIAKVYAVGLYLGVSEKGEKRASLDDICYTASAQQPAEIVIKLYRAVGAQELGQALADAVAPIVRKESADDPAADLNSLSAMGKALAGTNLGPTLPPGTELAFMRASDGLHVSVDGSSVGTYASPRLVNGFFKTFLGENAVVPSARIAWMQGLDNMFFTV